MLRGNINVEKVGIGIMFDIAGMKKAGAVAISDDGVAVKNARMMRLAMEYAKGFDMLLPIIVLVASALVMFPMTTYLLTASAFPKRSSQSARRSPLFASRQ